MYSRSIQRDSEISRKWVTCARLARVGVAREEEDGDARRREAEQGGEDAGNVASAILTVSRHEYI